MDKGIKSALISVSNKKNLKKLVEGLRQINPGITIFSSGGTAKKIRECGFEVTDVSKYTGFPEAPGGLVKTLHPKVHGGILLDAKRGPEKKYLEKNEIVPIQLVVVNLYPFEETLKRKATNEELVENIDIGGPTLIRSAAKGALRHGNVVPIIEPADYDKILRELSENNSLSKDTIISLVYKAFNHTCEYDEKIRDWTKKLVEGS